MINLNIILEDIPPVMLQGVVEDFIDVQESYNVLADATIRADIGRMCLDLENDAKSLAVALMNSLDMLDDMGLSPFIVEIGVLK
jgi:hypothetical protein